MTTISINHVSTHAQNLERSTAFYEQLFGMQRIPTPTFAFPLAWLRPGRQQLHLFLRSDAQPLHSHHAGLNVDNFAAIYRRAREQRLRLPDRRRLPNHPGPSERTVAMIPDATSQERVTVRIPTASGDEIDAWLYLPDRDGTHPAVAMGHGARP
jgi:catechol 2,3-dioxygenase-like lactoylglutathione lyase family enzyme